MFKKKYDLFFIFSIIFITVFGLFLLNDFLKNKDLDLYLQAVKEKIAEMIPAREKDQFEQLYSGFIQNVDDQKLQPSQLKELAEKIVILRQEKDTLSALDIEFILPKPQNWPPENPPQPQIAKIPGEEIEWNKIKEEFEKSLIKGDSIRILTIRHLNLKKELDQKLSEYSKISGEMLVNHEEISKKIKDIKDHSNLDESNPKQFIIELKSILSDNHQLKEDLMDLEEIEKTIQQEKEKLLQELKKIDSN